MAISICVEKYPEPWFGYGEKKINPRERERIQTSSYLDNPDTIFIDDFGQVQTKKKRIEGRRKGQVQTEGEKKRKA